MSLILLVLVSGVVILLVLLSLQSNHPAETGLVKDRLRACPNTPNCVCSEYENIPAYVEPLGYSIAHADAWQGIKEAVQQTGGEIKLEFKHYLHAVYTTPLFRFKDDVEIRLDEDNFMIHFRSASRVGHSDLGANRKRINKIKQTFLKQIQM